MTTSVTSEIWQDQFLETISTDLFQDTEDDSLKEEDHHEDERILTGFKAELSKVDPCGSGLKSDIKEERCYAIECLRSSSVDLVGLQVWRGALLLSDYILSHPDDFEGRNVLELAAGTGITSVIVSELASHVLCTDVDRGEILSTIKRNFELNKDLVRADYSIQEIDFFGEDWKSNLSDYISEVEVILVADVVYDPRLTECFFSALSYILSKSRRRLQVYFAIEKRNRVNETGSVLAPNFELFKYFLGSLAAEMNLELKELKVDFEQRFKCYERVEELFMWKLSS